MRIIVRMMEMQRIPCQTEGAQRASGCARSYVVSMGMRPDDGAELVAMLVSAALAARWTVIDNRLCCPACTALHAVVSAQRPQMGAA